MAREDATLLWGRKAFVPAVVILCLWAARVRAEDNTSTLITNLVNNGGADYIVGDTGTNNSLTISAGGVLTNVNDGYIGCQASASNNWAVVTGGGSAWFMTNNLLVGYFGSGNSLTIASSGRVFNALGYIGYAAESSNNAVTVTGSGSVWTNADLSIGRYGSGNSLAITNGATVYSSGVAWIGRYESSSSNSVLVSDPGSLWSFPSNTVRMNGTGNQLTISNGAMVFGLTSYIGYDAGNGNNAVLVTGSGSVWSNSSGLTLGYYGSSNQLTVSSGALVRNTTGTIGSRTSSCNNAVLVMGSSSVWTNTANLIVGTEGSGNALTIAGSGSVFNAAGHIGYYASASNNTVIVTGPGSVWSCSYDPTVGYYGSGNSLTITNGGAMITTDAYVGYKTNANNNVATITGSSSVWRITGGLQVGGSGASNSLTIANGGAMFATGGGYVGYYATSSNNVATITGSGSVWTNGANLVVGYYCSANSLAISGGGVVSNAAGYIGYQTNGNNNAVLVTGSGSVWNNSTNLYVGYNGSGNTMTIANSGAVYNVIGYISYDTTSNNAVLVTDPGSVWSLVSSVRINGGGNQLTISNGALVQADHGYIGLNAGPGGNAVLVTDPGTVWSNRANLFVGSNNSSGNRLTVSNGALVRSDLGRIGGTITASNNVALITGTGSVWSNSGDMYIGYDGISNQLTVSDGALVQNVNGYIGGHSNDANAVTVTGSGSIWTNSGNLYVGNLGSGNSLTITNNGAVFASNLIAGDGTHVATLNLRGGTLAVAGLATIQNNATLSGNGTISSVALVNGLAQADSGGGLTFLNTVTNNAVIRAINGAPVVFNAGVVNNGIMDGNAGSFVFNDSVINNGSIVSNGMMAAFFIANPTNGPASLPVTFTDSSAGTITNRCWDFGDGATTNITDTMLTHTYQSTGSCTVVLIVSGPDGVSTNTRPNYISIVGFDRTTLTWVNDTASGNWSDANSWWPPLVPDNVDTVVFATGGSTCIVDSVSRAVTNLVFNRNADFVLAASGGAQLTIHAGIATTGSYAHAITAPLVLSGSNVWNIGANSSLTIGGTVTGALPLTKSGAGTLTITGSVQITSGTVKLDGGTVLVTGNGSVWTNTSNLRVGSYGSGNTLTITNGAAVFDASGYIGYDASSSSNAALVTGSGSMWRSTGNFHVGGYYGSDNTLTITSSGTVCNVTGYIGYAAEASNNTVTVNGAGSVWTNSAGFVVGRYGPGNTLVVTNGGTVFSDDGYVGQYTNGNNNVVSITDSGSVWNINGKLYLGYGSTNNSVTITNQGQVLCSSDGIVGRNSDNNRMLVTGSGSIWNVDAYFHVGYAGFGNILTIVNSGAVFSSTAYIGYQTNANNNAIIVTGTSSVWSNSNDLLIGRHGYGNGLTITNGGGVFNATGCIGYGTNDSIGTGVIGGNNTVLVSDAGSVWNNSGDLDVGWYGEGNRLTISNGALVQNSSGYIGTWDNSSNNTVLVTGAGSIWSHSLALNVGFDGANNQMTISDGALVRNSNGYIGTQTNGNNNAVLVTGIGSIWTNAGNLYVGNRGASNTLTVADSGLVFANNLIAGNGTNAAMVNVLDGALSMANLLTIQKNATFSGNGTISGSVVVNGKVCAEGGTGLRFTGPVTNNASIVATNGATIIFDADVVNNGVLYARGGSFVFNDGFTNNGLINSNDLIVAYFTANPTNGGIPLAVSFTDLSVGAITNRYWDFGDGSTTNITDTTITHTYAGISSNTVMLIVSGPDGISTNSETVVVGPPLISTWVNTSASGNWSDVGNWSPAWVPDNAPTVIFGSGGLTCVVDSVSRTVSNLVFNRSTNFVVAASGGAQLSILNGITVLSNRTYTLTTPVVLANSNSWAINNGTLTAVGIITGSNSLSIAGPGTVNLSVSNAYTGDTILNSGTTILAADAATGSGPLYLAGGQIRPASNMNAVITSTAVLLADTTIPSGGSNLIFAGTVMLTNGARTLTLDGNAEIPGQISDNGLGYGFTRLGSGVLNLSASNTYSGPTVVNAGQLVVSNDFALGTSGVVTAGFGGAHGIVVLADGVTVSGITLYNFNKIAGWHGGLQVPSGNATWAGPIVLCVDGARISGNDGTLTITGPISDNGSNYMANFRAATVILSSTNNNWGGGTVFAEGRFFLGANNTLPTNTVVNLNEPGTVTLDMAGFNQQLAGLIHGSTTSAGILTNSGLTLSTLTLNIPSGMNCEYNAHIRGNIAIVKTGPGIFTLSGTNIYTGFTSIDEGTLALSGNAGLSNSPTITIASGARLDVTGRTGGGMTLFSSQTMRGGGIFNGNLVNQGVIIAEIASGQFTFTGTVTNNGTIYATNGATLAFYGPVVNNGVIDVIYGNTNFFFTFINNGIVLTAGGDNDGDGMSNLKESQAGTSPTNSDSCLRITSMAREGDDIRITWTAVGGKSYVVQTNSVPGGGYGDFTPVIYVPGVGESVTNYLHSGGATNASSFFYRIRLGP